MRVLRVPLTWFLYFCQKIPTHDMCDMHGMHRCGTEYMRKNKTRFPTDLLRCNTSPNMTEANDVCGGGEVIFNTSHQNYIYSLSVEHQWLCSSVSPSPILRPESILSFQKVRGPWVISATYVGTIINSLTFGQLVDKWGRKPIFHITNFTFLLCRLATHIFFLISPSSTLSGWSPSMLLTITGRSSSSLLLAQVSSPSESEQGEPGTKQGEL